MIDSIADMLTRIRNASAVRKPEAVLPCSKIKMSIAEILVRENYITSAEKVKVGKFDFIRLKLKYTDQVSAIRHIKMISKPGQRIYVATQDIPQILNGYGTAIISTSKGLMTGSEAAKNKIGGELMFEIW